MNIDPLLRYLRLRGRGGWGVFADRVNAFGPNLDSRSLARGLSEHALVEFDFEKSRWSACGTNLISVRLMSGGSAVSAWGGTPERLKYAGLAIEESRRTIHTWSGSVSYTHASRVLKPSNGWPRSWEPTDAARIRAIIPSLDAVSKKSKIKASPRSGRLLEFRFRSITRAKENRPTRWVEIGWSARHAIDPLVTGLWRINRGDFAFMYKGVAKRLTFEVGAWLAFRYWLFANGIEQGLVYDATRTTLYISAAPYLPVVYVRALMLSGARESGVIRDRLRAFYNVDRELCDWFTGLLGLPPL